MKACACQPLFARLGAIAEVVAQLGAQGMPVAAPRRTLGGAARAVTDEASALAVIVLPEVTGDFVDAGDPAAVRATAGRARAPRAAARLDALLADLPDLDVAAALVHGDVRGANVLVDSGRVTALLDYDSIVLGHRVLDLAARRLGSCRRPRALNRDPAGRLKAMPAERSASAASLGGGSRSLRRARSRSAASDRGSTPADRRAG